MSECYYGLYNEGRPHCDHFACDGKCYREWNFEAEGKPFKPCYWGRKHTDNEIRSHRLMLTYKQRKRDELAAEKERGMEAVRKAIKHIPLQNECKCEKPVWIRITWGLYQCSACGWDFPGGVKSKRFCPHCGIEIYSDRG